MCKLLVERGIVLKSVQLNAQPDFSLVNSAVAAYPIGSAIATCSSGFLLAVYDILAEEGFKPMCFDFRRLHFVDLGVMDTLFLRSHKCQMSLSTIEVKWDLLL